MANVITVLTGILGKTDAKSLIQDSASLKAHAQLASVAVKLVEAGCVLSGSYALKLQGLLPEERVVHDLDVVMHGTPTDVLEKLEQVLGGKSAKHTKRRGVRRAANTLRGRRCKSGRFPSGKPSKARP